MLTEQQKNYLSMLLVGDALTADEIRIFLSRSGWSPEQIDDGITLSNEIKKKSAGKAAAFFDTNPVKNNLEPANKINTSLAPGFASGLGYVNQQVAGGTALTSDIRVPLTHSMPEIPKSSDAGRILLFIAWLLFIILILMIIGLFGYMYYTKTELTIKTDFINNLINSMMIPKLF